MPDTVPKKPSSGATLATLARTMRRFSRRRHLVQRGGLDGLLDVFLGLPVLEQAGLHDRGQGTPVLLADLDRVAQRLVDDQRLAQLRQKLVDVDLGAAEYAPALDDHRQGERSRRRAGSTSPIRPPCIKSIDGSANVCQCSTSSWLVRPACREFGSRFSIFSVSTSQSKWAASPNIEPLICQEDPAVSGRMPPQALLAEPS